MRENTDKKKTPFFDTFHAVQIKRKDLETLFDEADYIIPYQVNCAVKEKHPFNQGYLFRYRCFCIALYNVYC